MGMGRVSSRASLAFALVFLIRLALCFERPSDEEIRAQADAGTKKWKGADFVLVVTHYNSSLAWLSRLPYQKHKLRVVVYIKQDDRVSHRCSDIDPALHEYLTCKELPNASGREAHTIAQFVYEYYDKLPRISVFAQDDCISRHEEIRPDDDEDWWKGASFNCRVLRLRTMTNVEGKALASQIERDPFNEETCLCNFVQEHNFRFCRPNEPFVEGSVPCYQLRVPITFLWELIGRSEHLAPETILWPGGAQFAAPAWALRTLPRLSYRVLRDLLVGTHMPLTYPDGDDGKLLYLPQNQVRAHPFTSFDLSHVCERAWFGMLDPMYVGKAEGKRKAHAELQKEIAQKKEQETAERAKEGGDHHHHGEARGGGEGRRRHLLALGDGGLAGAGGVGRFQGAEQSGDDPLAGMGGSGAAAAVAVTAGDDARRQLLLRGEHPLLSAGLGGVVATSSGGGGER